MVEAGPLERAVTRAAALTDGEGLEEECNWPASDAAGKASLAGAGGGDRKRRLSIFTPFSSGSTRAVHPSPDADADAEAQAAASAVESKRLEQQRGKSIQKERWQKASASSMTHARRVKRLQARAASAAPRCAHTRARRARTGVVAHRTLALRAATSAATQPTTPTSRPLLSPPFPYPSDT